MTGMKPFKESFKSQSRTPDGKTVEYKHVFVRMDEQTVNRLQKAATRNNRSVTGQVRHYIAEGLKADE